MIYRYPVSDIFNYDKEVLKREIAVQAGFPLKDIHMGNGFLVFEFSRELNKSEQTALTTIIQSHTPILYHGFQVKCAEDVDRITSQRIRHLVGGSNDPVQEQLKILTVLVRSLTIDIINATSLADLKTRLNTSLTEHVQFFNARETIIREGRDFKNLKGW